MIENDSAYVAVLTILCGCRLMHCKHHTNMLSTYCASFTRPINVAKRRHASRFQFIIDAFQNNSALVAGVIIRPFTHLDFLTGPNHAESCRDLPFERGGTHV